MFKQKTTTRPCNLRVHDCVLIAWTYNASDSYIYIYIVCYKTTCTWLKAAMCAQAFIRIYSLMEACFLTVSHYNAITTILNDFSVPSFGTCASSYGSLLPVRYSDEGIGALRRDC